MFTLTLVIVAYTHAHIKATQKFRKHLHEKPL